MPAKKRAGGRVTPKGTQPTGNHSTKHGERTAPVRAVDQLGPSKSRLSQGPVSSARSSHHRGNR
jgi:hypothetical protein